MSNLQDNKPKKLTREEVLENITPNSLYLENEFLKDYPEYLAEKDFVLNLIEKSWQHLYYVTDNKIRGDKDVARAALMKSGLALNYLFPLKWNKSAVLFAIKQDPHAYKFAAHTLKSDKELALVALSLNGLNLEYVNQDLLYDKDILRAAFKQNGFAIQYLPPEFEYDRSLTLVALQQDQEAIAYAPEEVKELLKDVPIKQVALVLQAIMEKEMITPTIKQVLDEPSEKERLGSNKKRM